MENIGAESNKIFLGTHKDKKVYLDMGKNANGHMLITGSTGTGKTNFLKNYMGELKEHQIVILDYSGSYGGLKDAKWVNATETAELLNFFEDYTDETMGVLADAIQGAFRFGLSQRATIIRALSKMMKPLKQEELSAETEDNFFRKYLRFDNGIARKDWALFTYLLSCKCESKGEQLASRMVEIVVHLSGKEVIQEHSDDKSGILIVGFSVEYSGVNAQLVELYLWKRWLEQVKNEKKITLVLDECQDLNWKKGSISERLLSEGRKFGISIILSTQFLVKNFPERVITSFTQSGFRVIFQPPEMEVKDIAKMLDSSSWKNYVGKLRNLRVGSCFVCGVLYLDERLSRQKLEIRVPEYNEK